MRVRVALVLMCLVVAALPISAYAVPTLAAGSATVSVGDTFDILISITGAVELTSWQFDLAFNPSIIRANSVTEGPFLSESGTKTTLFSSGVIDNVTGHITLVTDSFVDLPPGPSGSGVIADISFTALALGISPLTLSNVFLNDLDSGFSITNGQVTVLGTARVPEPATLTLLALGLAAARYVRWRGTRSRRA